MPPRPADDVARFERARVEYVHGLRETEDGDVVYPTLAQVAQRNGVGESALNGEATRKSWKHQREIHRREDLMESLREGSFDLVTEAVAATRLISAMHRQGVTVAKRVFTEAERAVRRAEAEEAELRNMGDPDPDVRAKLDWRSMRNASQVLMELSSSKQMAVGTPLVNQLPVPRDAIDHAADELSGDVQKQLTELRAVYAEENQVSIERRQHIVGEVVTDD